MEYQAFRFVEGIWIHRERVVRLDFFRKIYTLHHACVTCSELPSYLINMTKAEKGLHRENLNDRERHQRIFIGVTL